MIWIVLGVSIGFLVTGTAKGCAIGAVAAVVIIVADNLIQKYGK